MDKLDSFLHDLNELFERYNGAIIRSADEKHKLVASVQDGDKFIEAEFDEDINTYNIGDFKRLDVDT